MTLLPDFPFGDNVFNIKKREVNDLSLSYCFDVTPNGYKVFEVSGAVLKQGRRLFKTVTVAITEELFSFALLLSLFLLKSIQNSRRKLYKIKFWIVYISLTCIRKKKKHKKWFLDKKQNIKKSISIWWPLVLQQQILFVVSELEIYSSLLFEEIFCQKKKCFHFRNFNLVLK